MTGISSKPSYPRENLEFLYDSTNRKFYNGPPIVNEISILNANNYNATGFSHTIVTDTFNVPKLEKRTIAYHVLSNNSAVSGNCCPALYSFNGGRAATPSTLYTYAVVYKCKSEYHNPNYMYRYEFTANGGTLITEGGVHDVAKRIHLGNGWYWAWNTFTTNASTNWLGFMGFFYYRYSLQMDEVYVAKVLLVKGDYTALHPKFWPEINTTRSNSQSMKDLIRNRTITANNVVYANDGSISFNGSSSSYSVPNTNLTHGRDNFTYAAWVKFAGLSVNNTVFENGTWTNSLLIRHQSDGAGFLIYSMGSLRGTHSFTPTLGVWYHVAFVRDGTTMRFYLNGVQSSTITFDVNVAPSPSSFLIGQSQHAFGQNFNGNIELPMIYTRTLTATEVKRLHDSTKARFD